MERIISTTITPVDAGPPLLDFLARRFTYRSRMEWQLELAAGRLFLNGTAAAAGTPVAAGDLLVYRPAALPEPFVDRGYCVLFEDDDLLVVDKPAPLPCHPGGRYFRHTLWALLKEDRGLENPAFVNRLDRETSGVVLVAKNRESARRCQAQFAGQTVGKRYLVVVEGEFPREETMAAGRLAADTASGVRKKLRFFRSAEGAPQGARACSTGFRLLAMNNGLSLLAASPHTGRCHQIRATLCSLGFPVVGDKIYGVDERLFLRFLEDKLTTADRVRLRLERQALHAAELRLLHPTSGRPLIFFAPPPAAFSRLFPEARESLRA